MTDPSVPRTVAVVVTYASRTRLAAQAIRAAFAAGVRQAVLVTNGYGTPDVAEVQTALREFADRLAIVPLEANLGSAAGFARGIDAAVTMEGAEYIWLLDDDNVAQPDALTELATAMKLDSPDGGGAAWVSYRPARPYQRQLQSGRRALAFPHPSAFMYFDLQQFLVRRLTSVSGRLRRRSLRSLEARPRMPYGPYGGLFAHKDVFRAIGRPNQDFVLYEDDTEYTARLVRLGIALRLVPTSLVVDDDLPEPNRGGSGPTRLLDSGAEVRVFYAVRNRTYFEVHHCRRGARRALNGFVYRLALVAMSIPHSRWSRLRTILGAIDDGRSGRLGMNPRFPLQ